MPVWQATPTCSTRDEQRVGVAVEGRGAHVLHVAGRVALAPVLLTGSRPEGDAALGERAAHRLAVHPAEHEHLAGVLLLDDRGQQPVGVEGRPVERRAARGPGLLVELEFLVAALAHRTILPSAARAALTSAIVTSPLWNTDAASTASAPAAIAGAKSSTPPAPPDAITGTLDSSCMSAVSSRSKPRLVPSASIELTSSSPAPSSIAVRAQSSASRSVSVRPPCVVTTKPDGGAVGALHVERQHEHLGAEPVGDLGDERRPGDRGAVHADLVGAVAEEARDVLGGADAAADRERDEDLLGDALHHVVRGRAVVDRGGDVEEGELVGALVGVPGGELDGVAGVAEVLEVDALHDAAGGHVEARDHADGEGHQRLTAAPRGSR